MAPRGTPTYSSLNKISEATPQMPCFSERDIFFETKESVNFSKRVLSKPTKFSGFPFLNFSRPDKQVGRLRLAPFQNMSGVCSFKKERYCCFSKRLTSILICKF